jgi:hypothetical protein
MGILIFGLGVMATSLEVARASNIIYQSSVGPAVATIADDTNTLQCMLEIYVYKENKWMSGQVAREKGRKIYPILRREK